MKRLETVVAALMVVGCLVLPARAQQQAPPPPISGRGIPDDWSHHRLIFSEPSSPEALRRLQWEPRYRLQQASRNRFRLGSAAEILDAKALQIVHSWGRPVKSNKPVLKGDWSENLGSGAKVGAGMYPAKFSFSISSASCSDFVVFNTGLLGKSSQASVAAFSNLYSGCGGTVPSTYWAYNTGGTASTSATLSADGSQIAFVQTVSSVANLVLMKWKAANGSVSSPATPASETAGNYRSCMAPCMTTITFDGGFSPSPNDTNSAPFYDYTNDVIYVGDNAGLLHKFTGVFNGTPAEVTASPWPVTVVSSTTTCRAGTNGCLTLGSPVYDSVSGKIFVGNGITNNTFFFTGGMLSAVTASSGAVSSTSQLGHGTGVADAPLVDSAAGRVYAFVGNDGSSNCGSSQACSAVFQLHTDLSSPTETTVGTGHATSGAITLYSGTFDNRYYSGSQSSPSGNLYVCGNTAANAALYRIPITNNAMSGASIPMNTALSTANTTCSPVTEIFNSPTDWIFLSVQADGNTNSNVGCPATGCVMSFDVTSGSTPSSTAARAGAAGGTSGIVVDNAVASGIIAGASQVYFSTLSNGTCGGGCAVQAAQSGLN